MNVINNPKSISIDFDSNEIRVVEGRVSKKGITINKSISISIPENIYEDGMIKDMDQMTYLLKTGLSENKITLGNTNAVVNSSKIILREVLFPKIDVNDLDNLIKHQLGDYIPIHPEDYVVKYINLGTFLDNGVEKFNLLIIGVPTIMVESHLHLLRNVGLKPAVLDYKGNGICKLLSFGGNINNEVYNNKTIAFIDMSFENTGLTIIKDEHIKVSRIVEGSYNSVIESLMERLQLSENESRDAVDEIDNINHHTTMSNERFELKEIVKENIQDIIDRIEMIFRYYRTREIGNSIDLIIIHGELSKIEGVDKVFSNFFNIKCIRLNSISKLKFDGNLSLFANAIGGLIRVNGVKA